MGGRGGEIGAVEALDRLVRAAEPSASRRDFPCPWIHLFGDCKKGSDGCMHCELASEGGKDSALPAGVIAQLKAKSTPEMRKLYQC
eukprot:864468-Pleurochrysis_carterae.AAC.1